MDCKICGKKIVVKRTIKTLFDTTKLYLCNTCYEKYPMKLQAEHVLLENYRAIIISIFERYYPIDYNYFQPEYERIFLANYNRIGYHILFLDYLSLNDYTLEELNAIAEIMNLNLVVITFCLKK